MNENFSNDIIAWSERYGADNALLHLIDIMMDNLSDEELDIIADELWEYDSGVA